MVMEMSEEKESMEEKKEDEKVLKDFLMLTEAVQLFNNWKKREIIIQDEETRKEIIEAKLIEETIRKGLTSQTELVGINLKTIDKDELFEIASKLNGKTYLFDVKNQTVYETCIVIDKEGKEKDGILVQKLNENPTIYLINEAIKGDENKDVEKLFKAIKETKEIVSNLLYFDFSKNNPNTDLFLLMVNANFRRFYEQVYRKVVSVLKKRVFGNETDFKISASFSIYTWIPELSDTASYELITGDKGSGKTRHLETLGMICRRALSTSNTSIAFFARSIDKHGVVILIDEVRFKPKIEGSKEEEQDLWALIRAGSSRKGCYSRMLGASDEIRNYFVFGPKALATNWNIPEDVEDRCLKVEMYREPGFVPKEVNERTLKILQIMLSVLRLYFLKNFDKIRKLYEENRRELSSKDYDGRFIEIISNVLPFSTLTPEEVKMFQRKKSEVLDLSEAGEVFQIIYDMVSEKANLENINEEIILDFEEAVKRWLEYKMGMNREEIEAKIWPTEKLRHTTKFSIILKNNLGFETFRYSVRDKESVKKQRLIRIDPFKFRQLRKRFEEIFELKPPTQIRSIFKPLKVKDTVDTVDIVDTLEPEKNKPTLHKTQLEGSETQNMKDIYISPKGKGVSTCLPNPPETNLEIKETDKLSRKSTFPFITTLKDKAIKYANTHVIVDEFDVRRHIEKDAILVNYSDKDKGKVSKEIWDSLVKEGWLVLRTDGKYEFNPSKLRGG